MSAPDVFERGRVVWRGVEYRVTSVELDDEYPIWTVTFGRAARPGRLPDGAFRMRYRADGSLAGVSTARATYKRETAELFAAALQPHVLAVVAELDAALGTGPRALEAARGGLVRALRALVGEAARCAIKRDRDPDTGLLRDALAIAEILALYLTYLDETSVGRVLNALTTRTRAACPYEHEAARRAVLDLSRHLNNEGA